VLAVRPAVVVDAANVVGSVPDGWWRDRAGAADRLIGRVAALSRRGVEAARWELPEASWFPRWRIVLEGDARRATVRDAGESSDGLVEVVRAEGAGDDAIVAEAGRLRDEGSTVTVVTSDRGLSARVSDAGATVRGAGWLLDQL
jgi:hypothetical protein